MKKCYVFGKMALIIAVLMTVPFFVMAGDTPAGNEDVTKHPECPYCGMDREKFAYSRVYVEYDDGSNAGTCSFALCGDGPMALKIDKTPKSLI